MTGYVCRHNDDIRSGCVQVLLCGWEGYKHGAMLVELQLENSLLDKIVQRNLQ